MPSKNIVVLAGNLTRDPEMRYTNSGIAVASLGLAVTERYKSKGEEKESTAFVDVKCWARVAEYASSLKKGDAVYIFGKLVTESWDDKTTGRKRSKTLVQAETLLDEKPDAPAKRQPSPSATTSATKPEPKDDDEDSDVPF